MKKALFAIACTLAFASCKKESLSTSEKQKEVLGATLSTQALNHKMISDQSASSPTSIDFNDPTKPQFGGSAGDSNL